jgi:Flp pilus assembly protein TadB
MNNELWTDITGAALSLVGIVAWALAWSTGALVWWIAQLVVAILLAILLVRSRAARRRRNRSRRARALSGVGSHRPRA